MNRDRLLIISFVAVLMVIARLTVGQAAAEPKGEVIILQKKIQRQFNEENPEGTVDLKKIIEEELPKPPQCQEALVICQIAEVSFDITIKKQWQKFLIPELTTYEFAHTVPKIKNPIDQLTKSETVIMQEILARRELLTHLDGSAVKERGFFGALTWLGLLRLAHIKGLNADGETFEQDLSEQLNELRRKMASDEQYLEKHPLPRREEREPQEGDKLSELWRKYEYLAELGENASRVDAGDIPVGSNVDVNIDGFVDVKRIKE